MSGQNGKNVWFILSSKMEIAGSTSIIETTLTKYKDGL
jgi:hypothetical protein